MVYFVQAGVGGPIKIGMAVNVAARLAGLQTSHPETLVLLGVTEGGRREERFLHHDFREARLRGEWFRPVARLLELIDRVNRGQEGDYSPAPRVVPALDDILVLRAVVSEIRDEPHRAAIAESASRRRAKRAA